MEANYFKITGIKYYEILNADVTTNNSLLLSKIIDLFHYLLMFSINTQVIIQNRALSLVRYLGLSADNHLDGQNSCQ